ncbi:LysR family transcriptional regulator [Nodosilinea sp. LEGE 07088]|uniref:LysR family transcriptional regulator n=1 Tax=Nodosilinea sp. LEGE 07088 TaxID=2777968 RepID=UPI00187E56FC|nr:LysR family transcriptional regulator [Nodosilinea sp. LEGE 07088]MBE9140451.1 LysR family transcriptional regulator [Nodosilinea sp. LEGE 07088]
MSTIDVSRLKLFQLRAFVTVADSGSFGKAALDLEMTQSAISYAIAALEDELGIVLFLRGRKGAVLTPVGHEMIDSARQILQHLAQLAAIAETARGLETGRVRVAAIRSLATHWLPQVIAVFKERHPNIAVTITRCVNHGTVQEMLEQGVADIGLIDLYKNSGLDIYELFADNYLAFLPPGAEVNVKTPTWEQFQRYPLILPVPHDNSYTLLREYLANLPIQLEVAYEVNEDSTIVSMVAQGLGMTILPYLAAIPVPDTVITCPLPHALQRSLAAVILAEGLHRPAVYAFLETLPQVPAPPGTTVTNARPL